LASPSTGCAGEPEESLVPGLFDFRCFSIFTTTKTQVSAIPFAKQNNGPVGFIADEEVATIRLLEQSSNMSSDAFVARNKNIEHLGIDKAINVLFNRFAIAVGQRENFYNVGSQPLDKFVGPIVDERTRTDDDDSLGCWCTVRCYP
jgi:hypothetical protein